MRSQQFEAKSAANLAFSHYLRTGRRLPDSAFALDEVRMEAKFNPNHDPENGQFTFGPGGPNWGRSRSSPTSQARPASRATPTVRTSPPPSVRPLTPAAKPDIGALSARYETRSGGDPGRISSGANDPGGISYGSHQLSSKKGTADDFIASPEARAWAKQFLDLKAGTPEFGKQWKAVAAREPSAFEGAQKAYIGRTLYEPAVKRVAKATGYNLDIAHEAVRQVTYSVSVQHGGAAIILSRAVSQTDTKFKRTDASYQKQLIENIYSQRTEYTRAVTRRSLPGDAKSLNNAIKTRFPSERDDALRLLRGG